MKDVRYLKISCNGKIPPETADEKQQLEGLIHQGKSKVASDLGMSPLTENFLLSDVEPFTDTDVVDRSVSHAETPQASATISSKDMTVTDESSFCMNQHVVRGNPPIQMQSFPQAAYGPAGIPIQNIPSFDFCNRLCRNRTITFLNINRILSANINKFQFSTIQLIPLVQKMKWQI